MKSLRWLLPAAAIALVIVVPHAIYRARSAHLVDIVVLDKTVPFRTWVEHRSLFWLLDHLRVVKRDGTSYDMTTDYLGAYPPLVAGEPPERIADLNADAARGADLLYLVDTYGVYHDDLASGERMLAALERSPRHYGGLTLAEARVADDHVRSGRTLLAEFNTLGSPTPEAARDALEATLGVRWTRWIGRFFVELSDSEEIPMWLRRDYEREWNKPWEFAGPGYVLVQDDARVEVLREGIESKIPGLRIVREVPVDPLVAQAADGVPYPFWFDVVEAQPGTKTVATYRWDLTASGFERLRVRGLPSAFPAVTRRDSPGGGRAIYFAGDFADNPMETAEIPFAGYLRLRKILEAGAIAPSENAFYWRFYVPVMQTVLREVETR